MRGIWCHREKDAVKEGACGDLTRLIFPYTLNITLPSLLSILELKVPNLQPGPQGARDDWANLVGDVFSGVCYNASAQILVYGVNVSCSLGAS